MNEEIEKKYFEQYPKYRDMSELEKIDYEAEAMRKDKNVSDITFPQIEIDYTNTDRPTLEEYIKEHTQKLEPSHQKKIENLFDGGLDDKKSIQDISENLKVNIEKTREALKDVKDDSIERLKVEIDKAIEETTAQEDNNIPEDVKREFEELENIATRGKKLISNTEIYEMLLKIQGNLNDVAKNVQDKKQEQINITTMIFDRLRFIKGHISKWFLGILVISFLGGGVVFTTIYHNWDELTPTIDKLTSLFNFASSATKIVN